jgi:hypothetical protein
MRRQRGLDQFGVHPPQTGPDAQPPRR